MESPYGFALLTCDAVARDPGGKVTLYGIFDRISSSQFPTIHPMFAIYWRCNVPGPGRVGVTIYRPDGSQLAELEPVETNKAAMHNMQGTYTLGGFEFAHEGGYEFRLTYNGQAFLRTGLLLQRQS